MGKGKTVGTIAGDLTANLCQIILASIGLATIVRSSGALFQIHQMVWCSLFNIYRHNKGGFKTQNSFVFEEK